MDLLSKAYSNNSDDEGDGDEVHHHNNRHLHQQQPPPPKRLKLPYYPPTPYPKPEPTSQPPIPHAGGSVPGRYVSKREKALMASGSVIPNPNPPPSVPPPAMGSISKENLPRDILLYLRKQPNVSAEKNKLPSSVSIDLHGHRKPVNAVKWSTNHGRLGVLVKVLLCDQEVTGSSPGSGFLSQKNDREGLPLCTLIVEPFPDPCFAGTPKCIRLPVLTAARFDNLDMIKLVIIIVGCK